MKYRVRCNLADAPQVVDQMVWQELIAFDRRHGYLVSGGEVRLYAIATDPEPLKRCLIGMKAGDAGDLIATSIGGRWTDTIREAFQKLRRQGRALSADPRRSRPRA